MRLAPFAAPVTFIAVFASIPLLVLPAPVSWVVFLVLIALCVRSILVPRVEAERRAQGVLAGMPDREVVSKYLAFRGRSFLEPSAKQALVDSTIAEMVSGGWLYLRTREASPLKTLRSLGGGVTVDFVRSRGAGVAV